MEDNNCNSKVYFIGISKLVENELNSVFKVDNIDELKTSIEQYGLKQPLSVVKDGDNFKIISGHRRLAAVKQLFSENKTIKFGSRELSNQLPCIFDEEFKDEDEEFLNLMSSNKYRRLTPEETKEIIKKCETIFEKKIANGEISVEGTTKRDIIAKMACVSGRTVDKYLKVDGDDASEKAKKVKSVKSVIANIEKCIESIKTIEIDEYGKTDKQIITNSLQALINVCKKVK